MNFYFKSCIITFVLFCAGCASQVQKISSSPELCENIRIFSEGTVIGSSQTVTFFTDGDEGLFATKNCTWSNMEIKGRKLCEWLSVNIGTEFMSQNISRVLACFTDNKSLNGKNFRIKEWSGKFTIYEPYKDVQNIDIDFEYSYNKKSVNVRNYFSITVRGVNNSEE